MINFAAVTVKSASRIDRMTGLPRLMSFGFSFPNEVERDVFGVRIEI